MVALAEVAVCARRRPAETGTGSDVGMEMATGSPPPGRDPGGAGAASLMECLHPAGGRTGCADLTGVPILRAEGSDIRVWDAWTDRKTRPAGHRLDRDGRLRLTREFALRWGRSQSAGRTDFASGYSARRNGWHATQRGALAAWTAIPAPANRNGADRGTSADCRLGPYDIATARGREDSASRNRYGFRIRMQSGTALSRRTLRIAARHEQTPGDSPPTATPPRQRPRPVPIVTRHRCSRRAPKRSPPAHRPNT